MAGSSEGRRTRLRHGHQIGADATELAGRHLDAGRVLGVGNTQMLLVNVHELEVILGNTVVLGALEDKVQAVGGIFGLEGQDVFVLRGAQHLGERGQVDAERDVAVTPEGRESFGLQRHGHQGNMAVIHGLERDAAVIAVKVAVLDQVLNGVDNLEDARQYTVRGSLEVLHAALTFFRMLACSNRASSMAGAVLVLGRSLWMAGSTTCTSERARCTEKTYSKD